MTDTAQTTASSDAPRFGPVGQAWAVLSDWWAVNVIRNVQQTKIIAKARDESAMSAHYVFMTCMSAGIAILGLLLSSPAVVIGAMLLSPLMGPILGAGFALAIGDARWLKRAVITVLLGSAVAIGFCALIVLLSPLQDITPEIAARTRPNLFDLGVAFFSAMAGSYAMIRGREGTIVGVAIATALMPPLAVVGYGLALGNWTVFGGSLLLFFTNLMTIALTTTVIGKLYGFRSSMAPRYGALQGVVIFAVFLSLAIPLGFSLNQIAWEANAGRQVRGYLNDEFGNDARVDQVEIAFAAVPLQISATVFTPEFEPEAEARANRILGRQLNRQVNVVIEQFRVGTDRGDADAAQLAAAQVREQAQAQERAVTQVSERLALVAGVPTDQVTVDMVNRRAEVRATRLPDAGLATYYALEQRVTALEPEWGIMVRPPALPLPRIAMEDNTPTTQGQAALRLALWAAERIDAPVGVRGNDADSAMTLEAFRSAGLVAVERDGAAQNGVVTLEWLAPDAATE